MNYKTEYYGKIVMNSYLPTQRAIKFLNYFQTAGWHECNSIYQRSYEKGITGSLLIFTIKGKGVLQLNGTTHKLNAGTVALVPPDVPVSYYTYPKSEWEFYWININGTYVSQITSCLLEEHNCVFNTCNMINYVNMIKHMIFMKDDNKFRFELEVSQTIIGLLHEIVGELYHIAKEKSQFESLSVKIANYLEQNYKEAIPLEKLSRMFHISKNQLIRVFQADVGYTPFEYLKRYRLLKASELLHVTNNTVEEIALLTGFPNTSNFIFQFKKQYEVTPNNYRKLFSSSLNKQ